MNRCRFTLVFFLSLSLMVAIIGCGGMSDPPPTGKTLTSVAITPTSASIAVGATQQFTATATYSDNSTANVTSTASWASATVATATVTSAGLATGVAAGSTAITASLNGVSGSATLTVTAAAKTLKSISVSPANPSIMVGATQQFTATATYSDNSTANVTSTASWT
ncbi:MAG: Ig-like domain-containing protein, partial [Acidobacteriaceae bacterium]